MFSNPTAKTVSDALLQLHRHGTHKDFPSRLFACLKTAFLGDFFSYDECTESSSNRIELYPAAAVNIDVLTGWISNRPEILGVYQYSSYPGILHLRAPLLSGGSGLHEELLVLLGQQHHLRVVICDERSRVDAVVSRTVLPIPPAITAEMAKGFTLYMVKAVFNGRGDDLVDLARSNLWA